MVETAFAPGSKVKYEAFAARLEQAVQHHPHCPPLQQGLYPWIVKGLSQKGINLSIESVRRWFAGESLPKPDKVNALAEILGTDPSWLMLGGEAAVTPRERKARNAVTTGAANLIAGMIQIAGGTVAFPDEDDKRASRERIHLYAIIKGAQYPMHIAFGEPKDDDSFQFDLPYDMESVLAIGVVDRGNFCFDVFELPADAAGSGARHGKGTFNVADLQQIKTFAQRL